MTDALAPAAPGAFRRMLFVGPLAHGTTTLQRLHAMRELGLEVDTVDTRPPWLAKRMLTLRWRVHRRLVGYRDEAGANAQLFALPSRPAPDVVWIEKGLAIEAATLRTLRTRWPDAVLVAYSPDDMFNPLNQSPQWLEGIPIYDFHITDKLFQMDELRSAGARDVIYAVKGYSPRVHRPLDVSEADRILLGGDVGFIGWPERPRIRSMTHLARHGVGIRIWGPWLRWWPHHPGLRIEGRPLWNDDYARAICSFRINLCFLRAANRDPQTSRSVEIPACGGFMLAQRTDEHRHLFAEDREAVFFSSDDELLERVRYYLEHDEERLRIAAAGLERCRAGRYDHVSRLGAILRSVWNRRARAPEDQEPGGTAGGERRTASPRSQNCSTIEPYSGVR